MQTFTIVYAERQYRQWSLEIEAESVEQVKEIFESSNEDIWSKEYGEALDTFDTEWHIEDESGTEFNS